MYPISIPPPCPREFRNFAGRFPTRAIIGWNVRPLNDDTVVLSAYIMSGIIHPLSGSDVWHQAIWEHAHLYLIKVIERRTCASHQSLALQGSSTNWTSRSEYTLNFWIGYQSKKWTSIGSFAKLITHSRRDRICTVCFSFTTRPSAAVYDVEITSSWNCKATRVKISRYSEWNQRTVPEFYQIQ